MLHQFIRNPHGRCEIPPEPMRRTIFKVDQTRAAFPSRDQQADKTAKAQELGVLVRPFSKRGASPTIQTGESFRESFYPEMPYLSSELPQLRAIRRAALG